MEDNGHLIPLTDKQIDAALAWAYKYRGFDLNIRRPLQGFMTLSSASELPDTPNASQRTAGYLIDGELWLWDETERDWANCGGIQGPDGKPGPKGDDGNDGVVLDGVNLAPSMASLDEYTEQELKAVVPDGNTILELSADVNAVDADLQNTKMAVNGGTVTETLDGKSSDVYGSSSTAFLRWDGTTLYRNSHSSAKQWTIVTAGTNITRIQGKSRFNGTSYTGFVILSFYKATPWTEEELPEGWVNLGKYSGDSRYRAAPAELIVAKSANDVLFDVVPPSVARGVYIEAYGASNAVITLTKETVVTGHEGRITALESAAESSGERLEDVESVINGGERTETVTGTTLVNPAKYYLNGSMVMKNHNSYRRWIFDNDNYTQVRAYVGLNTALASGMCTIAFYDGSSWSVLDNSYVLTANTAMAWYEADVPSGTEKICVCHRNSAGTAQIQLIRVWTADPIEERVETLEEKVEAISGDGKDRMTRHETRDQDCLMLRNHIKTTWPYFFAAAGTGYDNQPYLDRKIAQIPDGKHFIFVTDTHWGTGSNNGNPSKNSTYIASYVSKRLGGCPVIFGGDCINSEDSEYDAAMRLSMYADEFFAAFGDNGLWVQGNHDSNKLGTGLTSDAEVYRRTVARLAHKVTFDEWSLEHLYTDVHDMTDEQLPEAEGWLRLHYHWDDEDRKVRYIVYETGCCGPTITQFVTGGSYQLPALFRWLARTLKSTPEGYDIIIAGHMFGTSHSDYLSGDSDGNNLMKMLCAFRMGTSVSINMRLSHLKASDFRDMMYGTSDSFSANFSDTAFTGRLVIVSGHWHNDRAYIKSTAGATPYPVEYTDAAVTDASVLHVNVNTDHLARNPYYPDRADTALGTVGEVSFDVITLTDDDKVVCTRIGYYDGTVCPLFDENGERVFRLTPVEEEEPTEEEN